MSPSQFIANVRGAISEQAMSDSELTELYNSIRNDPFQFKQSDDDQVFALAAPKLRGSLDRRHSGFIARWTTRYFVLTDGCLYYFPGAGQTDEPLGVLQLIGVNVLPLKDNQIQIVTIEHQLQFVKFRKRKPVFIPGVKQMVLRAEDRELRDKWLYRIRTTCVYANFNPGEGQSTTIMTEVSSLADGEAGSKRSCLRPALDPRESVELSDV
jgi:hypothetical protein